jgi:RNA polymerase sigma-70 factor, ECF subfamily
VFVNLWQKRHQLKIEKNLKAYLYICVKHGALAVIKLRQPHVLNIDDLLVDERLTDKDTPEQYLAFKELEGHFEWAINKLPPRCKQVFLLKWREELSYHDIGEILGISEKTVENQLVNAMCKIKECLRFYQINEVRNSPA